MDDESHDTPPAPRRGPSAALILGTIGLCGLALTTGGGASALLMAASYLCLFATVITSGQRGPEDHDWGNTSWDDKQAAAPPAVAATLEVPSQRQWVETVQVAKSNGRVH
jgi:hypothetical protein